MDAFYQHAYGLISSQTAREAFNLKAEPDALKDQYGRNDAGMRMLMARRLVEGRRPVRLAWSMADGITTSMSRPASRRTCRNSTKPTPPSSATSTSAACSTPLSSWSPPSSAAPRRSTRTPGATIGPGVFSVLLAGGGLKRGTVYGSSDATGSEPDENPLSVEDFAMTIYHQLGIDGAKTLMSPGNRPIDIVRGGQVVQDLLA